MKMKKLCAILICVILLTAALPVSAYADFTIPDNNGRTFFTTDELIVEGVLLPDGTTGAILKNATLTIGVGGTLIILGGRTLTIEANGVLNNAGSIDGLTGSINNKGAFSGDGAILSSIVSNTGTVEYNNNTILNNSGNVTNNNGNIDTNEGTVDNNFGIIGQNNDTVKNNFGGEVCGTPAVNNYYAVTITGGDHTTNSLTVVNGRLWLKNGGSAVFSPQSGYVITAAVSGNQAATFTNNNGVWTLTAADGNAANTEVTLAVSSAVITGLTLSTNAPTVGTPITATVEPAGATVTYQWYTNNYASTLNGTAIIGAESASFTPADDDAGKYLYCIATGTGSYSGTANALATVMVAKDASSSVPHTGSDRQTGLMLTLALFSGAVLAYGVVKRKKSA